MGFFSGTCVECGHSILSEWALTDQMRRKDGEKLTRIVLLEKEQTITGIYDGYGRILPSNFGNPMIHTTDEMSIRDKVFWGTVPEFNMEPEIAYHQCCYDAADNPQYDPDLPRSKRADDQGFFIEEETYLNLLDTL